MKKQETIFKTCSKVGGSIKKYKAQQKFERKLSNGTEEQIYADEEGMSIYGLLEHVMNQREQAHKPYYRMKIQ